MDPGRPPDEERFSSSLMGVMEFEVPFTVVGAPEVSV